MKSWFYFVSSKLILTKHVSIVQKNKDLLTYAIVSGMKFDEGAVIEKSILESIYGKVFTHPSLIIELYLRAKVEISKDEEKLPPMIPLPFPKENKSRPTKPTTKGKQEGREENAPKFKDSKSEEDEAEERHNHSAL